MGNVCHHSTAFADWYNQVQHNLLKIFYLSFKHAPSYISIVSFNMKIHILPSFQQIEALRRNCLFTCCFTYLPRLSGECVTQFEKWYASILRSNSRPWIPTEPVSRLWRIIRMCLYRRRQLAHFVHVHWHGEICYTDKCKSLSQHTMRNILLSWLCVSVISTKNNIQHTSGLQNNSMTSLSSENMSALRSLKCGMGGPFAKHFIL